MTNKPWELTELDIDNCYNRATKKEAIIAAEVMSQKKMLEYLSGKQLLIHEYEADAEPCGCLSCNLLAEFGIGEE